MMKKLEYKVTFTTPAFLGNAEQSGQWRTPPFKALLRQWWRVAVAESHNYKYEEIREKEGRLFGNAWLDSGATRSQVRVRLNQWTEGASKWESLPRIGNGKTQVPADLYLGYGPVKNSRGTPPTALKHNAAIQAGDSATLSLAIPGDCEEEIAMALGLIDRFGTLGGRSRNGWGSVRLEPQSGISTPQDGINAFSALLDDALTKDWPHAIGCDKSGMLIWQTKQVVDWKRAMTDLAKLRKAINAKFDKSKRPLLSYPVTGNRKWENNRRIPNSLRFKVVPAADGHVKGLAFHLPCLPPKEFGPKKDTVKEVWRKVHAFLDRPSESGLERVQS